MIAIYRTSTGELVSCCTTQSEVANPLPANLSQKTVNDPVPGQVWNIPTLDFITPPASRIRNKIQWLSQFTLTEIRSLSAASVNLTSTNRTNVMTFERYLSMLGDTINLDDPFVTAGLDAMVTATILTTARRTTMLT